ncbi:MAG: hypothetical protein ACR2JB_05505, partial [Bryobacteraceae bacterium]
MEPIRRPQQRVCHKKVSIREAYSWHSEERLKRVLQIKEKLIYMLRQAKDLNGYKLGARDGEIGKVREFYFDDQSWAVRYLVADTGDWLSG